MWGLIDIMLQSKTPIYTYCTGYAMSAAFKIFLAGEKRFISKHATLIYHQLSSWESGTYQHFVEYQVELDRQQGMIEQYVQDRTHITESTLQAIREKKQNWFINYEEAMHLGVATDIVG